MAFSHLPERKALAVHQAGGGIQMSFSEALEVLPFLPNAASYRTLTSIAIDHVCEGEKTPFCKRFADLFQDKSILLMSRSGSFRSDVKFPRNVGRHSCHNSNQDYLLYCCCVNDCILYKIFGKLWMS